jgi:hypothetical protein
MAVSVCKRRFSPQRLKKILPQRRREIDQKDDKRLTGKNLNIT